MSVLFHRMKRVWLLDSGVYEEVAADPEATGQALATLFLAVRTVFGYRNVRHVLAVCLTTWAAFVIVTLFVRFLL